MFVCVIDEFQQTLSNGNFAAHGLKNYGYKL